jgi:hypothetical protein
LLRLLVLAGLCVAALSAQGVQAAAADSSVTVDAHDLASGNTLGDHGGFTYLINVDNAHLGNAPDPKNGPMLAPTETFSPIVAEGDQDHATMTLPDDCTGQVNAALPDPKNNNHIGCRYLISVRSPDHKMWGKHITLPNDAGTVRVDLSEASAARPLPTGKIKFYVFNDNAWTNGAPDAEEITTGLGPNGGTDMHGFHVTLEEQTNSQVHVDYHNRPLCTAPGSVTNTPGDCTTQSDGFVQINDLSPATYFLYVTPPSGPCNSNPDSRWIQTTTFDGGLGQQTSVEEGSDGSGAPGEQLWEPPDRRTAYWAGFVCVPQDWPSSGPNSNGSGEITGRAVNWQGWPPFDTLIFDENHPVDKPYVTLSDSNTDTTVWGGRGDEQGNFDIQNVPTGDYWLTIWDEQLNYILRFVQVHVDNGQTTDLSDVGVSRWFGWLDGTTYLDKNGNGQYDPGVDQPLPNSAMDQRWPDGSIKEETTTDNTGRYEYPTAEGGQLGKWIINEQGFDRFSAYPGPSVHDEQNPNSVLPSCSQVDPITGDPVDPPSACLPVDKGGGLLSNQLIGEGHEATVDWGKRSYPAGTPGQIVGITYFATTRNEFNARDAVHEVYEPAIPKVQVRLESAAELGPDMKAGTGDEPAWNSSFIVNEYTTDKWQKPGQSNDGQSCTPIMGVGGPVADQNQFNPLVAPECIEVPINGMQTKDGAFDGGYAFNSYCVNGYDEAYAQNHADTPCWSDADHTGQGPNDGHEATTPLTPQKYVVRVLMPQSGNAAPCNPDPNAAATQGFKNVSTDPAATPSTDGCLYRPEKEEDVNVDLGAQFSPAIPPPDCVGDPHVIDQATLTNRSNFWTGDQSTSPTQPLCDMRLINLKAQQNANSDFFMVTNFPALTQHPDLAPNHLDPVGDVAEPTRLFGAVFDDINFDRDPKSVWYGEPRAIANIPVGIYAVDAPAPTDPNHPNTNVETGPANWRLLTTVTTDQNGAYEALVPSTETYNCPIPQGPCPGMYIVVVDDPGSKAHPNSNYNPNYLTANTVTDAWPGRTNVSLDTPIDPISGTSCTQSRVDSGGAVISTRPELLQVSRPYVLSTDSGTNRRITIDGDFIGPAGATGATGGHVVLTDQRTGTATTLTRANGGIVSWTPNNTTTGVTDRIVIQVPALTGTFTAGPKQLDIVTSTTNAGGALTTSDAITLHVLGGTGANAYNPPIVNVQPPSSGPHALQNAIDSAAANSLVVLSPGIYEENVVLWKPLKLQGLGPGGIIGAKEEQQAQPDDPRFNVLGTTIDGRFFNSNNITDWHATVSGHAPYAGVDANNPVMEGADITVLAQSTGAYGSGFNAARIDGLGLQLGHGDGAGGIQAQAYANNLRITNDVLEGNGGVFGGGIALGQPYVRNASGPIAAGPGGVGGSHNNNVQIKNNRLLGNGGLTSSGAIGLFSGSDGYELASNYVCGNYGVEYGAGISHWGYSPNGSIHDNQIFYNQAVDSGAGIAISDQTGPAAPAPLGAGSGAVNVDRNEIVGNFSGDDGGGVFVHNALDVAINLRNNMIVDNGAADMGAVTLDDSSRVAIVNNTIADNVTTGTAETTKPIDQGGVPHAAGLASEQSDTRFTGHGNFSNPIALFNNIFRNNEAFLLDHAGPGASLVSQGIIDFEVNGTNVHADTFTPRYSILTNGNILRGDGQSDSVPAGQGNNVGADPGFVDPFTLELAVAGAALDPQSASVTITGADPLDGVPGNYHITAGSPAIDNGVKCALMPFPAPANAVTAPCAGTGRGVQAPTGLPSATNPGGGGDFDGDYRPLLRTLRVRTPWDLGADELTPGVTIPVP